MGPRKSATDAIETGYPAFMYKLCQEEDVLIIPDFVTHGVDKQPENPSPRKSKDSKAVEKYDTDSILQNNSFEEENDILNPPQVAIVYETPENKEKPTTIICKNIYIEYSLINAIGKSLRPFPTISSLKIENCCISKEMAEGLALILAEEPGRRISDLSLDGNEGLQQVLPLFLSFPTGLKYLSLQRCSLDDEGVRLLAKPLEHSDEKEDRLLVLLLGMNRITDVGVVYLANALRTNRTLISLSLAGNQIGDEGVIYLSDVLQKFKLTYEEVVLKRKRIFDQIFKKKKEFEKRIEERRTKGESENLSTKLSANSTDRFVRKIRGADGKIRCLSSRDKRGKSSQTNPGEKFRGKPRSGVGEGQTGIDLTPNELLSIAQQIDSEMSPDRHPFVNEVFVYEDGYWCPGCWSLNNLNLAYNNLTEISILELTKVCLYQSENVKPSKPGLMRLILLPGNQIYETSNEYQNLQRAIAHRGSKKEVSESPDVAPVNSVSSARRMSSSTRKMKNR